MPELPLQATAGRPAAGSVEAPSPTHPWIPIGTPRYLLPASPVDDIAPAAGDSPRFGGAPAGGGSQLGADIGSSADVSVAQVHQGGHGGGQIGSGSVGDAAALRAVVAIAAVAAALLLCMGG